MRMFVEPDDIYLHTDFVDFRKLINGLLAIIESELAADSSLKCITPKQL